MIQAEPFDARNASPKEFIEKLSTLGLEESRARRLIGSIVGRGDYEPAQWQQKGIVPKRLLADCSPLPRLHLEKSIISPKDSFQKLLFRSVDNLPIETVIIPLHNEKRATVCLSSQVGCVMGCAFCATARMVERRSLHTWEIVDQLVQARKLAAIRGRRISGVVFMGMGEPFLNYRRVISAAEIFSFPVLNAIDAKAITISTVGILPAITRFTSERRSYRLSISLGAATDAKRELLVPVAARFPIRLIVQAARQHAIATKTRVMLSYVCISNVNMFEEDARALGELIGSTPVRLDLIEVNDETGRFRPPDTNEMSRFRDALTKYVGQPVARRYSGGADIKAACGTLAGL